jgi:hypothetical protein
MAFPNCFVDSFSHYSTADLWGTGSGQKWTGFGASSSTGNVFISSGTGIVGNSLRIQPNTNVVYVSKTLANLATWIIGFRFRVTVFHTTGLCILLDSGNPQVTLFLNSDGTLSAFNGAVTAVTGGRSTNVIYPNIWYYVEMKCTINSSISANTWQVNVNGTNWINVATGQSSKSTSNTTANQVALGNWSGANASGNQYNDYCDFYCDGGGSVNGGAFWGDIKVECHWPIAQGTYSSWVPQGGLAVGCVDDLMPNGDINFIAINTTNSKSTFLFQSLVYPPTGIVCAQVTHVSKKTDAGTRQITDYCVSGSATTAGNTVSLANGYIMYTNIITQDPNTLAAWTASGINAAEFGVEQLT